MESWGLFIFLLRVRLLFRKLVFKNKRGDKITDLSICSSCVRNGNRISRHL